MANSNSSFPISQVLRNMITRKNPDDALAGAAKGGLEKTLGVWDLIILGVGAIIGSGIFAVVGIAAAGSADGSSPGAGQKVNENLEKTAKTQEKPVYFLRFAIQNLPQ